MKLRTFLKGDRFVELTWKGLDVEVARGKVGQNGRVRREGFTNTTHRQDFVEREAAKALRAGYVEVTGVALPNTVGDSDPVRNALDALRAKHARTAWLPRVEGEPAGPGQSQLGGRATLPPSVDVPRCARCARPMSLVVQLRTADVGPGLDGLGDRLLQAFVCRDHLDDTHDPAAGASTVRLVPPVGLLEPERGPEPEPSSSPSSPSSPSTSSARPWPGRRIVGFEARVELPLVVEAQARGVKVTPSMREALSRAIAVGEGPWAGDKVLGHPYVPSDRPAFLDGWPACPACGARMEQWIPIDSRRALDVTWGAGEAASVVGCQAHPDGAVLRWPRAGSA